MPSGPPGMTSRSTSRPYFSKMPPLFATYKGNPEPPSPALLWMWRSAADTSRGKLKLKQTNTSWMIFNMSLVLLGGYSAKREVVKFEFKLLLRQTGRKTG